MEEGSKIVVSVCVITYNQETYILDTIKGIINQKGDFKIELIISDDCSTDNTLSMINELIKKVKRTDIDIEVISHQKNIGASKNFFSTLKKATSEFIAICEGDDYWIDENKIQKQIDFLVENKKCSCVFTNAFVEKENDSFNKTLFLNKDKSHYVIPYDVFTQGGGVYPTATLLFRNFDIQIPEKLLKYNIGDSILIMFLLGKGDIYYLNELTSVYRIHNSGVYSKLLDKTFNLLQHKIYAIEILNFFDSYYQGKFKSEIEIAKSNISKIIIGHSTKIKADGDYVIKSMKFKNFMFLILQLIKIYFSK